MYVHIWQASLCLHYFTFDMPIKSPYTLYVVIPPFGRHRPVALIALTLSVGSTVYM